VAAAPAHRLLADILLFFGPLLSSDGLRQPGRVFSLSHRFDFVSSLLRINPENL
jgi:hypothetical protein